MKVYFRVYALPWSGSLYIKWFNRVFFPKSTVLTFNVISWCLEAESAVVRFAQWRKALTKTTAPVLGGNVCKEVREAPSKNALLGLADNCQRFSVRGDNCQREQLSEGTTVRGDNCQRTNCQRKLSELFWHWDNCKLLQFWGGQL